MKKTENIEKMQKYQIKNEDDFAQNQMNSSQILFIVTIIQLVICVIIGVYHFFHEKNFQTKNVVTFLNNYKLFIILNYIKYTLNI